MPFLIILFGVIAIGLSAFLIPKILVIAFRKRLFDIPDSRKDHVGAIPRLGGISFYPSIFFCFALCEAIVNPDSITLLRTDFIVSYRYNR